MTKGFMKLGLSLVVASMVFTGCSDDDNDDKKGTLNPTISFNDSMKVLYYEIENPETGNNQLIAYDYEKESSHVINTNVILKNKVFIYEGTKDGKKEKYVSKKYGLYLDPEQGSQERTVETTSHGQTSTSTYNFYTNNALMKFNPSAPLQTSYIFQSSNIPDALIKAGTTKLSGEYKVLENVIDVDNSYVKLTVFNSLADTVKGETPSSKKQADITVRLGDSKVVIGTPLVIIRDTAFKTTGVLVSSSDAYVPDNSDGSYKLKLYDKSLNTATDIADGQFFFATQNDANIYLFKKGSNKLWRLPKVNATSLDEVTGITLAGNYDYDIHAKGSRHGSTSNVIDGGTTLSGRNSHLNDGENAYLSFHYNLQENVGTAFVFGTFGAYKSSQVFKLTGNSGVKIFDNGDGVDYSLDNARIIDGVNGHINLVAVSGDKLYTEIGWYDGNATLGGTCKTGYPRPSVPNSLGCTKVKYGFLDTTATTSANDATVLKYDDNNNSLDKDLIVSGLPYYVARRISPLASDGKLYISTFDGGGRRTGYKYKQYVFNLGEDTTKIQKVGRTYFAKTAKSESGEYSGVVMQWDQGTQTIQGDGINVSTASINGTKGSSISGVTSGVPLSGIGTIGMLKNNIGNHEFELFAIDVEEKTIKYVDFAPFGGWIYE